MANLLCRCNGDVKQAFTLAELLVSVLIISIIMVVLAPVITKRVTSNINVSGGGGSTKKESKLFLYNPTDPNCSAVSGQNALDCNFTTGTGVKSVNVVMVSGGGGGAGATTPNYDYGKKITVTNSTIGSAKTQEFTITKGMKNFTVTYLAGSGGGGGGGAWVEEQGGAPTSQADCDRYDAKYLTAAQNGGKAVCVTKYNIGDIPSATNGGIATSVKTVQTNRTCSANSCCWQGKTADPCNSSGTSYSGCNRTVCTWYAGNASCQALAYNGTKAGDWRLPTKNELSKWASNINTINKNKGDNGLRLCDYYSGFGAAHCYYYGVCDGARNDHCYPREVWSSTPTGSNYYYFNLNNGSFNQNNQNPRYADSVRCVLEGGAQTFNSFAGGGGGGASFFKNYQIPDDLIVNNIGGRIVFYAAPGAKGGNGASSSNSNASNGYSGTASYIALYDKTNKLIWGLEASGGNGGRGATSTNAGNGGAEAGLSSCKIFQNNTWTNTNCTSAGPKGADGSTSTDSTAAANGGAGGGSMYSSTALSGGGVGGSNSSENGGNGAYYGAGGGGATTRFVTSSGTTTAAAGKGGYGANGVAEITYDLTYESAAGGGGGGGAMLKVENITVTPSTTYTVRVGGGGNGGAIMNNGTDGGESKVTFAGGTYVLSGGKGGKVGTSGTAGVAAVHGVGGLGAAKSSVGVSVAGSDGSSGTISNIGSIGGSGGKSGIESEGGCGALFSNGVNCSATTTYGLSTMFVSPSNIFDAAEFGSAGAGGGGGGYAYNTTIYPTDNPGYGGNGQNGYVYIYWTDYD